MANIQKILLVLCSCIGYGLKINITSFISTLGIEELCMVYLR